MGREHLNFYVRFSAQHAVLRMLISKEVNGPCAEFHFCQQDRGGGVCTDKATLGGSGPVRVDKELGKGK